ncbi:hypothetical protein EDB19DRAFT_1834930 [Suillus lakei]|nr:hypothetical protein EDB19DRAFT_1834930 [Suillus lakei]
MFTKCDATNCSAKLQSFDDIIKVLQLPNDTDPLNFSIRNLATRDANENHPDHSLYPKDENGCPISLATLKSIHCGCRGVWAKLVVKKLAPPTWARLCAMGRKLVHTFMEKEFPLFRLDADGWKLSLLCTTDYPNCRKSHINNESNWKTDNKKVVKREATGSHDNIDGNITSKGKKRVRNTDDTKATHKRVKVADSLVRIPSPALCDPDTAAKSVLGKKSKASNVDGADATQSTRMRPGPVKNRRNLCAIRWQKNINKKGTTEQFKLYWGALSMAQQDEYQAEAECLNSAGFWKKPSDSAIVNGILY